MKKRNGLIILLLILGIVGMIYVEGYLKPKAHEETLQYELEQNDPATHDIRRSLKYANQYMGNAGNLSNLNISLPWHDLRRTFQLYPDELTAEIRYQAVAYEQDRQKLKQFLAYNSTANFVMIDNLELLVLEFEDLSFTIQRKDVAAWFIDQSGHNLIDLQHPETWHSEVQTRVQQEEYAQQFVERLVEQQGGGPVKRSINLMR
ncbi:hypothetical protein JCM10914A_07200 [Paenibacillus sp. JCM 10914]|uniref:DUF4825 domain-containing protein n=1 Tax=Paenibacillus sp. JCM 10914 TaxID=1236974 RepID=UPI0003CC59E3|nr:DUF4825 domain-containing protein [Paenibacillus sp. JCM 10914]GAE05775.1 hypothetical protein JCM10914_1897 [Paenibacillus sp. JCM 10914]